MNIDRLRQQLEIDEGCKYVIYLDHLNLPTHGIGHLILESDPEYGQPVGTSVSEDRVIECFEKDLESVQKDCYRLYDDFDDLPETVQEIIANMLFNMGLGRMKAFKGMKRNVDARQWDKAADEMVDSRWYNQVGERSKRLVERMRSV
jgi:lysozyme|tara:strand:- start:244 stop:684 length:441 start_codon:yes stop_codon:yes gene_type:complete